MDAPTRELSGYSSAMPTPGERKALLFLGTVVVLGAGARGASVLNSRAPVDAAARSALETQIEAVDSARQRVRSKAKRSAKKKKSPVHIVDASPDIESTPVVPAIIDLDIATAAEIETLRGVGPSLSQRIVADRDSLGPFGSIDELQRVRGIGARLAARIAPQVTFSLLPRHPRTAHDGTSAPPRSRRKSRRGDSHT
jgi:competence ComEA-like helix-hairpin-helix protein